jgi:death on curing protein
MHADLLRAFGGSHGLRDGGLLESALARPRHTWSYNTEADIPALAAVYAVGIARNHAFIDGNKRTAFQTMYAFLVLNGVRLSAPEAEVVTMMRDVATGAVNEETLAARVRAHVETR